MNSMTVRASRPGVVCIKQKSSSAFWIMRIFFICTPAARPQFDPSFLPCCNLFCVVFVQAAPARVPGAHKDCTQELVLSVLSPQTQLVVVVASPQTLVCITSTKPSNTKQGRK